MSGVGGVRSDPTLFVRTQSVAVAKAQVDVDPLDPLDRSVVATPERFVLPAPPPVERFDFNGFVVANTDTSVMAALVEVAQDGGLDAVRTQLRRVRDSVEAFADTYEGRGNAAHDRRAEAGRDLIAKLATTAAALERVETKAVSAVVSRGSAVVRAAVARSRSKLDDAKQRYGLTATRSRPPKSDVVVTTYTMADSPDARDLAKTSGRLAALRDEVLAARRLAGRAKASAAYSGDRFERYDDVGVTVAQAESKQIAAEAAYASALAEAMKAHPVLAMFQAVDDDDALDALAAGPSAEAARVLGSEIARIEKNLATVERELAADPAVVLSMPRIVEAAGVPSDPLLARMVGDATAGVARDKVLTDVAMAAISVALGIAAAIPTGGAGFVLAAGAAAVVDVVDVVRELDLYATQAAFAGTDFDERQAFAEAPSAFGASMAVLGAAGSAAGVALGLSALARAMRSNRALGFVAKKLIRETSAREVEAMYAALGAEALESWGLELSGRRIAALVETHGDRLGAFARALSPRRAASLLEQLGPEALRAFDGMDPRLLDLAVRDLGITNVQALAPLGGEAVARVHQAMGSALANIQLAVVGDRVEIEGLVQVTDFARRAAADPRAMAQLAGVSKSIQANGGLAAATIPELLDFADACRCAGVKLPEGLTPVARERLAAELKRASRAKGTAGDAIARQALVDGARLGAFDANKKPLPADAVVVDSQMLISQRIMDESGYEGLQDGQKAAVAFMRQIKPERVRVTDAATIEARRGSDLPGFSMSVSRSSEEYGAVMKALCDKDVGTPKGSADRSIVADLLFAETADGAAATFAVQDTRVFRRLAQNFGVGVDPTLRDASEFLANHPTGFIIEVGRRRLRVLPVAAKVTVE